MSDHGDTTTTTDFSSEAYGQINFDSSTQLSPLAGGGDMEAQGEYVQVGDEIEYEYEEDSDGEPEQIEERIVREDGTVEIHITHKKKKVKKIKANKNATTKANELSGAAVKLVAVAVDNASSAQHELPPGVITTGKWDTTLFSCFDFCVPNCCMATFCPCVTAAQIASRLGFAYWTALIVFGVAIGLEYILWSVSSATMRSTDYASGYTYDYNYGTYRYRTYAVTTSSFPVAGYLSTVVAIAVFVAFWQLRTKVREKFALPGSCVEDFFVSCCCSCCALAQMATHVKSYKPSSCDFGPPSELSAYQQ